MQINWGLLGGAPDIGARFQEGMQQGRAIVREHQLKGVLSSYIADPTNLDTQNALAGLVPEFGMKLASSKAASAAEATERQRVGSFYTSSGGDPSKARDAALVGGDVETAKLFEGMADDKRKQVAGVYKTIAPLAYQLRQMPAAERAAAFQQSLPVLRDMGLPEDMLSGFDVTNDAQLDTIVNTGRTVEQLIDQGKITWRQQGEFGDIALDSMGRPIGRNNPARASVPSAPPQATPAVADIDATPGAVLTSGYRTPEKNKAVGGVAGSYHTRKDANGEPMGKDFVPPRGMSMAELETDLKRRNPGKDVINEGNHVHVEPGAGGALSGPVKVASKAEFDRLPTGARFVAPDGSVRMKP